MLLDKLDNKKFFSSEPLKFLFIAKELDDFILDLILFCNNLYLLYTYSV